MIWSLFFLGLAFFACFFALIVLLCSCGLAPQGEMDDWIASWYTGREDIGDKTLKEYIDESNYE